MKLLTIFLGLLVILAVFATQAKAEPEPEPKFGIGKFIKKVIKNGPKVVKTVKKGVKKTVKVVKVIKKVASNELVQQGASLLLDKLVNKGTGDTQPEETEEVVEYVEEE